MKKLIYNLQLLSLMLILISVGVLSSCEKEEDASSSKVELISFGPSGVKHGDQIKFLGKNLNKVLAIKVVGDSIPSSSFISQTSSEIVLVVPEKAERGFVTLVTSEGNIVSKTNLDLEVPVTITSFTEQTRPEENITISGHFVNWIKSVTFERDILVGDTDFISKSLDQIVVKVPKNAQTGKLVFKTGGVEPLTITSETPFKVTLPAFTTILPASVKHAGKITITGTNLDLVQGLMFTGVTNAITSFVSQSPTQIEVLVPTGAKTGPVSFVAFSGVKVPSTNDLTMILPAATSLTPNPVAPESDLTIAGTDLDLVTSVSFTGISSPVTSFVSQSATQLVVKVPTGTLKGKLVFGVKNSTLTVETAVLSIIGGLPPLADFPLAIYTDSPQNGFQDWSYTDSHVFNSTENVRQGTTSIKASYGTSGYQGVTFHNGTGVSTTGYTKIEFSVFATAGTGGKKLNVVVNGGYTNPPQVTLVEGEWSTFTVELSAVGSPATLTEIVLQSAGWSGVIHIDHVGLR